MLNGFYDYSTHVAHVARLYKSAVLFVCLRVFGLLVQTARIIHTSTQADRRRHARRRASPQSRRARARVVRVQIPVLPKRALACCCRRRPYIIHASLCSRMRYTHAIYIEQHIILAHALADVGLWRVRSFVGEYICRARANVEPASQPASPSQHPAAINKREGFVIFRVRWRPDIRRCAHIARCRHIGYKRKKALRGK